MTVPSKATSAGCWPDANAAAPANPRFWRAVVRSVRKLSLLGAALSALVCAMPEASAQTMLNSGFQINRYEPTAAGEWSFGVDHPWYSSTRYFAAGITLNYAHKPLVLGIDNGSSFDEQEKGLITH